MSDNNDKAIAALRARPPCAGCGEPSVGTFGTIPTCQQCYDNYQAGHEEMGQLMEEHPYDG